MNVVMVHMMVVFFRGKTEYEIGVGLIRPSDYISTSEAESCDGDGYWDGKR